MNVTKYRFPILIGTVFIFIGIWQLLAIFVNNPQAIAGPLGTGNSFVKLYHNPILAATFVTGMENTLEEIFIGFALGAVVGIPIGIAMGKYLIADYFLDPWVNAWYSIPVVAFVPLTMNWFGLTVEAAIVISFLVSVFSIILNVYYGTKSVSNTLVETAHSFGAREGTLLAKIIFPAAMPDIMLGLRLGITRAIDGVIIAEMIFSVFGLGGLIFDAADKLQMGYANAFIIILAIISITLNETMKQISRRVVAWKEAAAMVRQ